MAMIMLPSHATTFSIKEREVKAMHQQLVSGMSILSYWLANLLHDMTWVVLVTLFSLILIQASSLEGFIGTTNYGCICILCTLFGTAGHSFAYLVSFIFSKPESCQMAVTGILMGALEIGVACNLFKVEGWIRFCLSLVPSVCLFNGLQKNFMEALPSSSGDPRNSPFNFEVAGYDIIFLICDSFIYFGLAVCVEYAVNNQKLLKCVSWKPSNVPDVKDMEDEDVKKERTDILEDRRKNSSVILRGLRKIYQTGRNTPAVIAVNDLCFSVAKGEIFGLLGANGAGKTTTMLLLTGGDFPLSGSASLLGLDILEDQSKLRRHFGFCSQSNALFDSLTGSQTLELYAKIKGINSQFIPTLIERMVEKLQLKKFTDQKVETYSGGNKRKLCVAISLIGGPQIVFLDEPSAGVDPVARRWMWRFIKDNMTGRTVLLTTHAMDEAETLCDRIGIMVNGQMRCIGTPEELKYKYVRGYSLECYLEEKKEGEGNVVQVKEYIEDKFPGSDILEEQSFLVKFLIPPTKSLGTIFKIIEAEKENLGIQKYALSETSLEQVFLSFVADQVNPELE